MRSLKLAILYDSGNMHSELDSYVACERWQYESCAFSKQLFLTVHFRDFRSSSSNSEK